MKVISYLILSTVLFGICPRLFSQTQYDWNYIIQNTGGLEIGTQQKSLNSATNSNSESWSIHSIFWNNSVDIDGDGYTRSRHLNWTFKSSYNPSFSVYFKLFYKEKTLSSYKLYVQSPEITGRCTYSYCDYQFTDFVIGEAISLSHNEYDFKIELYDYSTNTLLASATPTDFYSFNDEKFENTSEDVTATEIDWTMVSGITSKSLHCIQFVNQDIGYIGGDYNTLIKTTDGGNNWQLIPYLDGKNENIRSLFFISENIGWVSEYYGRGLYKTTDGGKTWTHQLNNNQSGTGSVESIFFLDENNGYVAGMRFILKTSDGGNTWSEVNSPSNAALNSMYFFNDSTGWSGGYEFLSKTNDGVNSWTNQLTWRNSHLIESIIFNDENNGWACGKHQRVYKIYNENNSYDIVHEVYPSVRLYGIASINANTVFSVGYGGKVLKTVDGGDNWSEQNSGTNETLNDIDFSDNTNVWAVGWNGVILHHKLPEPFLSVSTEQINFNHNKSDEVTFNVYSNVAYNITTDVDWISITPNEGLNNSTISVTTLSQNANPNERNCEISVFSAGLETIKIQVSQQATPFLDVSPTNITLNDSLGSSNFVSVESNISWAIEYDSSWLSIDSMYGANNKTVHFSSTSTNTSVNERNTTVTFSGENVPDKTVNVTQSGATPFVGLSNNSITLSSVGGSNGSFSISSNTTWTISGIPNWLDVVPNSGTGDEEITLTASNENASTIPRTTTLKISANGVSDEVIDIIQEGATPYLDINSNVITIGNRGGSSAGFNILSNDIWTLETDDEWFILSKSNGSNNDTITVTALTNNEQSQTRLGSITVSNLDTLSKVITLIQSGYPLGIEHKYASYISVFPNPTSSKINLKIPYPITSAKVILSDNSGKIIYSNSFSGSDTDIIIELSSSGLYFLRIIDNENQVIKTEKVVVY